MSDEPKEPDVVPLDDPTVPDSLVPIPDRVAAPTPETPSHQIDETAKEPTE